MKFVFLNAMFFKTSLLKKKPHVIGIAWVVDCVEQRAKMDEEKYKVDVELINVAGGIKVAFLTSFSVDNVA